MKDEKIMEILQKLGATIESHQAGERVKTLKEFCTEGMVLSTSFGLQATVMLKLVSEYAPKTPVIFVDTGYNFPETYQYIDEVISVLDLNMHYYAPLYSAAQQEARWGKLWEQGKDGLHKYSMINKVEPMNRALSNLNAKVWLSGLRRSQSKTRSNRKFVELQGDTIKAYPILDWQDDQVAHFIETHNLPKHPLIEKGYVTMGDWHSTKAKTEGLSSEETRFGGEKYECGLHLESHQSDYQI